MLFFNKLHDFIREVAFILADDDRNSILCSDCVKRMADMATQVDIEMLSVTSGFGSNCTSEVDEDDDDVNQLKLLVEITTGRRIYPITQERAKTFHAPERDKECHTSKRRKRRIKVSDIKKYKKKENKADQNNEKKTARISAKFKEVEIKSADAAVRKAKLKSA
jgi:hypothetical protein